MSNSQQLADLLNLGHGWRTAMQAVPREAFVPVVGLANPEDGDPYPIDRDARPEQWRTAVYSDTSIITQRDDGRGDPLVISTGLSSSSISAPGIAFRSLQLMAARDHDRVLEIGTGTGYTAAVLAARVGQHNVTSIEVDPAVAKQAAANLEATGYSPHLIVGDGLAGNPEGSPYDRVLATVAVAEVPYAWVAQARPGGTIVAPWQPLRGHGLIVRLTVGHETAYGRFHGPAGYMMLRAQRAPVVWDPHDHDEADVTATRLDPRTVADAGTGLELAVLGRAPGLAYLPAARDDGSFSLLLFEVGAPEGSWAACDYQPGEDTFEVTQFGDRRLWNEVEGAFGWWVEQDSPGADRFGLVVSQEGERVWLDEPSHLL